MTDTLGPARPAPDADSPAAPAKSLLTQRNFVIFWLGQTVSKVGNGAYQVALGWSVYELSGSAAAMGVVLALNFLPQVVLALVGGAVADRLSRRTVVLVADSAAALVVGVLALSAATNRLSLPLLMTAALLLGTISAFYTPAYAAMNRELLTENDFRKANSVFSASGSLARLAGPLLAGVSFGIGGAAFVFTLNAVSFGVAALAMAATKTASRTTVTPMQGIWPELSAGLAYTRRTRWLSLIIAISLVANILCLAPYSVLLPALVRQAGAGVGTLGLLSAVEIAIVLLGAVVIGRMRGIKAGTALLVLGASLGLGSLVLGSLGGHLVMLFAGAMLFGAGLSFDVIENTLLQNLVPEHLLSRVYSVNMALSYSLLPLGYLFSGLLARHMGPSLVLTVGGVLMLIVCGCAALLPSMKQLDTVRC
ncbi:MFS transporter [Streptomyces sp. NPDC020875]|uniref:MFS transporter n=1 Tax=Streptomyces sp. NPDC020875 TaxID=3154898 RepID=UPI0033FD18F4